MVIILWVALSLFMALVVDLVSFSLKRKGWDRFASSFFLFYSQVIITEFVLGFPSLLTGANLAIINIAISALVFLFVCKKFGSQALRGFIDGYKDFGKDITVNLKRDPMWLALLVIAGLLLLWVFFLGSIFPATDFDGNSYHLTFVGNVIQNHNFYDTPTSLGWLTGYPKGGEFIELWNVLIPKNDIFVDLVQIPFAILGVYALYQISRRLGVDKREARFVSLLFIFLPIVINQLKTTYLDVILCSLFFAAIAYVFKEKLGKLDLAILGIIFSLIIAIKSTGVLFVVALAPILIWNLFKTKQKDNMSFLGGYFSPLLIVFIPTLFGFYWYIKNLVLYANPLYPFGLKAFGVTVFPGKTFQDLAAGAISQLPDLPRGAVARIWYVWTEQKDWWGCLYNYDANFTGLGPIWLIILVPAIIVSLYFVFKKKNYSYVTLFLVVLAVFLVYPINYYPRYTMFIAALGIVSLGIVFTNTSKVFSNIIKGLCIALAIVVFSTNFVMCNFPPVIIKSQIKGIASGNTRGLAYENTIGKAYIYLQNSMETGDTVVYGSSPYFIYPFWKSDYSNKVIYIPADNSESWLRELKQKGTDFVFMTIGSKEYEWIKNYPEAKSIYKDVQYEIFTVY